MSYRPSLSFAYDPWKDRNRKGKKNHRSGKSVFILSQTVSLKASAKVVELAIYKGWKHFNNSHHLRFAISHPEYKAKRIYIQKYAVCMSHSVLLWKLLYSAWITGTLKNWIKNQNESTRLTYLAPTMDLFCLHIQDSLQGHKYILCIQFLLNNISREMLLTFLEEQNRNVCFGGTNVWKLKSLVFSSFFYDSVRHSQGLRLWTSRLQFSFPELKFLLFFSYH